MSAAPEDILTYATAEEIQQCTEDLAATFDAGLTRPAAFRKQQLRQLVRFCDEQRDALTDAIYKDLRKHPVEGAATEVALLRDEAARALASLDKWLKPVYPSTRITFMASNPHIRRDPQGMVMVMGTWNYPVGLLLLPVVGAIAAGNTVVIKPSELAPHTAKTIGEKLPLYLDQRAYRVIQGAVKECTQLLETRFDHIFYTGSGSVGRIVMQAAAKHLTPVSLELGGKSPTIIHRSCNLAVSVQRILFGKFLSSGQTCIAPDYVLCPRDMIPAFAAEFRKVSLQFLGSNSRESESYARIINARHFNRLAGLLEEAKKAGGEVLVGGATDSETRFIEPTLVRCTLDSPLMRDELFGPLLPIIEMDSIDEAIAYINRRDQPLALYLFATDKKVIDLVTNSTRSGSILINEATVHFSVPQLPFGGSGQSGMGRYRGKASFDTFTHQRSVLHGGYFDEPLRKKLLYPPYKLSDLPTILFVLFRYAPGSQKARKVILLGLAALVVALVFKLHNYMG